MLDNRQYTILGYRYDMTSFSLAIHKIIDIFQRLRRCQFRSRQRPFVLSAIIYKKPLDISPDNLLFVKFYHILKRTKSLKLSDVKLDTRKEQMTWGVHKYMSSIFDELNVILISHHNYHEYSSTPSGSKYNVYMISVEKRGERYPMGIQTRYSKQTCIKI